MSWFPFCFYPLLSYNFYSFFLCPFPVSYVVNTLVSAFPEAHFLIFKRKLRPERLVVAAAPDRGPPLRRSNRYTPRGNFLPEIASCCPVSSGPTIGKANFFVFYLDPVTFDIDSVLFFPCKTSGTPKRTCLLLSHRENIPLSYSQILNFRI